MANNFLITISAIDRVTATVAKINASMNRITAPIRNIQRSAQALTKELGFDKFGKSLTSVGKSVGDLGGKLASIAAPLGVVVGGGTLAGVAALATEWGRLGSEISRSALTLGMAAGELQGLRGAARAAGLSSEELSGGLKSLGDTMEDALYGRNQQALVLLNRLGIGFRKTADGSIDTARSFRDLAGAIGGIKNVQAQALVARTFGMESLLPLLRQGPAAIDAYERKVRELGGVMSGQALAAAESFGLSLNYLDIATKGLKNTIGEKLIPILQPLVDRLTTWTAANRELIATKVGDFVAGLARWIDKLDFNRIADDIKDFGKEVDDVVNKLGGWKNAAIGVVVIMNAGLIESVIRLGTALAGLAITGVPAVVRSIGLLAIGLKSMLAPALSEAAASTAIFTAVSADAAVGVPILGATLSGLSLTFAAVSTAILATPIGWFLAGAAAIVAGGALIYKYWEPIKAFFAGFGEGVADAFEPALPVFKAVAGWVKTIFGWFGDLLSPVSAASDKTKAFGNAGRLAGKLFVAAFSPLSSLIEGIVAGMKWISSHTPGSSYPSVVSTPNSSVAKIAAAGQPVSGPASPTRAATPVGVRNNNPGNLRTWGDLPRDAGGYARFPTPEAGLAATIQNLQAQQDKHGLNTLRQIIGKWAPPGENNTAAYIDDLVKKTGFGADQQLNLHDQATVAPIVKGIIKHEGNGAMFSDDQINAGVAAQTGAAPAAAAPASGAQRIEVALTLTGVPAGMSASARTKDGITMPVRVSYTMPTNSTP